MTKPWFGCWCWAMLTCSLAPLAAMAGPADATDACRAHFSVSGGQLSGYNLKTFKDFPALAPSRAFLSIAKAIAADGATLQNTNEKLGTLSALGALGPNVAAARPVNVFVSGVPPGSRVELSWSVGPFVSFHRGDVEARFCTWLDRLSPSSK